MLIIILKSRESPCGLADDVQQHYVHNPEDWDNFDLLEKCDALSCLQAY